MPADISEISHSGTGRVSRMLMRPMSLYEAGESNSSVSLSDIFSEKKIAGTSGLNLEQIAFLICRGGWPKSIDSAPNIAIKQAINYYDSVVNLDISRVDNVQRDAERTKRILRSYARAIGSQAKITSITQDVYINEVENKGDLSNKSVTINAYISALKKIFVIENSLAWNPNLRSKTATRTSIHVILLIRQ